MRAGEMSAGRKRQVKVASGSGPEAFCESVRIFRARGKSMCGTVREISRISPQTRNSLI